jgi:integrase
MQNCGQGFRYAVATGRAERDPTGDLRGALPPPKEKHHASIIEPKAIGQLLRAIDAYEGFFVTKCAMRLALSAEERSKIWIHVRGQVTTIPNSAVIFSTSSLNKTASR